MNLRRCGHGMVYSIFTDTIYALGGYGGGTSFHTTLETLALSRSGLQHANWRVDRREISEGRSGHGFALGPDRCLYVVGGSKNGSDMLRSCCRLDTRCSSWEEVAALNVARGYTTAGFDANGYLYAIGGTQDFTVPPEVHMERYDSRMNKWVIASGSAGQLHRGRQSHALGVVYPGRGALPLSNSSEH
eukprot:CAMPEP_0185256848 /NCGR_PEP_ID=MMETSP1359-20130426/5923_1 /TAXON_ID=552665 /ORGANISM="Bigelowiella longifila, Strain CCMP242" /LENGTH=187 /DNA_ID=CAMNT_0027841631 /DNA_START=69 /DNA_END=632 /DNA_ORIENTATION=-